ncbi:MULTISPECIES: TonB-dependent receptor [Novosphingobium]|uniref:TonB-dependent receptor n=1 Tax=Novosphingobium TaxID=165696 RepID=UPI001CD43503|nr:TonB-dependent receptor [Novosphingobium percolationis]
MQRNFLLAASALAIVAGGQTAQAQSTGSADVEDAIVVTGARGETAVNGIKAPDTPKAKAVLTQELIARQNPGKAIFDTINIVPGVNFTSTDPYGAGGGNLRIRGFDGARISATFDGIQVNDSGNYALYTNQQLDSELIEQVNINFGATDVDSPTASAAGGTVNYRTRLPKQDLGATFNYSHGTYDYNRVFGAIDTGEIGPWGTRAFVAASNTRYDQFRGPGEIRKTQYNARIYQPLGGNGDFVSIAGHYNQNRNNFYRRVGVNDMRTLLGTDTVPVTGSITPATPLDLSKISSSQYDTLFGYNNDASCTLGPKGEVPAAATGTCGGYYGLSINPSDTGNLRFNSRFTLASNLILTVDASYQYTLANGGGSSVFAESDAAAGTNGAYNRQGSRLGAGVAAGADLNGDGDLSDFVRLYFPSNTRTHRIGGTASLRWDIEPGQTVRLAYTYDRARHRQTGEAGYLQSNGNPLDDFGGISAGAAAVDAAGNVIQKRDRLSYAILHQVAGEYVGHFADDALTLQLGVRAPFFKRNLTNNCWTIAGSSNDAYCTSESAATVAAKYPAYAAPYKGRTVSYNTVLPNAGFVYKVTPAVSVFGNFSQGFSAPRTDNLYAFDGVKIQPTIDVKPERTNSFDLGLRYGSGKVQAQLSGWYIGYKNRIISSQVLLEDGSSLNIDRNVGRVKSYGVDASVAFKPVDMVSLYAFGSWISAKLQDNVLDAAGNVSSATKDKFVAETPKWQVGGRVQFDLDPVSVGVQGKYVGKRYLTDINDVIAPSYTTVDLDARYRIGKIGRGSAWLQLNVINLFDKQYFANLSTQPQASNNPQVEFGAPRTIVGSINLDF